MDLEKTLIQAQELSQKNWIHAVHLLTQAEDEHPNDPRIQIGLGDLYFNRLNFSHALKYYLKVLSISPGDSRIIHAIGTCYLYRHDFRLALAYFKRITNPKEDVLYNIGYAQALLGKHEDCIKTMQELLTKMPNHPYIYFILIEQYFEIGKLDDALYYVKKADKMAGPHSQSYVLAGLIYSTREQWLPAYYYYYKADEQGPINNPEHVLRYANSARMVGKINHSISILLKGESMFPYLSDIYVMLIRSLIETKQIEKARKAAKRARKNLDAIPPVLKLLIQRLNDL
jgi:tetratricopeptide (TPR) repeat protein